MCSLNDSPCSGFRGNHSQIPKRGRPNAINWCGKHLAYLTRCLESGLSTRMALYFYLIVVYLSSHVQAKHGKLLNCEKSLGMTSISYGKTYLGFQNMVWSQGLSNISAQLSHCPCIFYRCRPNTIWPISFIFTGLFLQRSAIYCILRNWHTQGLEIRCQTHLNWLKYEKEWIESNKSCHSVFENIKIRIFACN